MHPVVVHNVLMLEPTDGSKAHRRMLIMPRFYLRLQLILL